VLEELPRGAEARPAAAHHHGFWLGVAGVSVGVGTCNVNTPRKIIALSIRDVWAWVWQSSHPQRPSTGSLARRLRVCQSRGLKVSRSHSVGGCARALEWRMNVECSSQYFPIFS